MSPALATNAWFAFWRLGVGAHRLPFPLLNLSRRDQLVRRGVDACMEGFPRSANTFAFQAFRKMNPETRVASHVHAPMQVIRAARLRIPCAVLIREPLAAISSFLLYEGGRVAPGLAIRAYVDFYRRVSGVAGSFVLVRFEDVVADPAVVARRLNERFGTSFRGEVLSAEAREWLVALIEHYDRKRTEEPMQYTVPLDEKDERKPEVRRAVAAHPRFPDARAIYAELTSP